MAFFENFNASLTSGDLLCDPHAEPASNGNGEHLLAKHRFFRPILFSPSRSIGNTWEPTAAFVFQL